MSQLDLTLIAAWVTALISLLGVIASLIGVAWQVRKQWRLHSASLVTSLDDRFNSAEWRGYRKQCQEKLSAHHLGTAELDLSENFPVLPFFENLGYLTHTGALDKMMVWNKFGWYVVGYYLALTTPTDVISKVREKEGEPTLWEEFKWLYEESVKIYRKKGIQFDDANSHNLKIAQLLKWESTLLISPSDSRLILMK